MWNTAEAVRGGGGLNKSRLPQHQDLLGSTCGYLAGALPDEAHHAEARSNYGQDSGRQHCDYPSRDYPRCAAAQDERNEHWAQRHQEFEKFFFEAHR